MKYYFIFLAGIIFFSSCGIGNETSTETDTKAIKRDSAMVASFNNLNACYLMTIEKDTAKLQLDIHDGIVKGKLDYLPAEKDKNIGTIEGIVQNEHIKLWYRFQSEGRTSVRQVYFKIIGDKLTEGYGEIDQRKDSVYFKYPATLRYENQHPYIKVNCN